MSVVSSFRLAGKRPRPLVLLAFLAVSWLGCSSDGSGAERGVRVVGEAATAPTKGRLVVLGIDGLPPAFLDSMIRSGLVPTFARLAEEGVIGTVDVLAAGLPPLSPRIWTSFATGQLPEVHGLLGFVRRHHGDEVLFNSTMRKSPAIWNIASKLGKRVGVANWWGTAPVEPVDGFIVSDLYNDVAASLMARRLEISFESDRASVVHPPSLMEVLSGVQAIDRKVGGSIERAEIVDSNVMEIAEVALERHEVDILLVYTRAFDELAHVTWATHERLPGEEPARRDLIVEYIRRYDWLLQRFVRLLRPQDHLMMLSDHGFERSTEKGTLGGIHESPETASAFFFLSGPRIRRAARIEPIDILDVLPTMLELAGLPAARDMPGRVAADAFLPSERKFLPRVDSYQLDAGVELEEDQSEGDDAMKERLRALGYLEE